MKKIFGFLFITLLASNLFSQDCIENIEKTEWYQYKSISDKIYEEADSIRFVMLPFNKNNPTIFFLAGSGNRPLFFTLDTLTFLNIPFNVYEYANDFNFVCISKPGTPLCTKWNENPPLIDTTFPDIMEFYKMDFLDYYVNQLNQVIDYLKVLSDGPIYLIGGSQGARVVSKYASVYKDKVQKLVPYSCGILDRHHEEILKWRKLADCGSISHEEAQKNIDEVYKRYLHKKEYYTYFEQNPDAEIYYTQVQHYSMLTDYSYNFGDVQLDNLLKIDVPILCVYGTDDIKARDNDMLPMFFARANKNNCTILPKLNLDHSFFLNKYDPETGETKQVYMGEEVFKEIMDWLRKD